MGKGHEEIFLQREYRSKREGEREKEKKRENTEVANRHVKMCATLLTIRETKIRTTVKYHYNSTKTANMVRVTPQKN